MPYRMERGASRDKPRGQTVPIWTACFALLLVFALSVWVGRPGSSTGTVLSASPPISPRTEPSGVTVSWTKVRPDIFYPAYVTGERAVYITTTTWLGEPQESPPPGPAGQGGEGWELIYSPDGSVDAPMVLFQAEELVEPEPVVQEIFGLELLAPAAPAPESLPSSSEPVVQEIFGLELPLPADPTASLTFSVVSGDYVSALDLWRLPTAEGPRLIGTWSYPGSWVSARGDYLCDVKGSSLCLIDQFAMTQPLAGLPKAGVGLSDWYWAYDGSGLYAVIRSTDGKSDVWWCPVDGEAERLRSFPFPYRYFVGTGPSGVYFLNQNGWLYMLNRRGIKLTYFFEPQVKDPLIISPDGQRLLWGTVGEYGVMDLRNGRSVQAPVPAGRRPRDPTAAWPGLDGLLAIYSEDRSDLSDISLLVYAYSDREMTLVAEVTPPTVDPPLSFDESVEPVFVAPGTISVVLTDAAAEKKNWSVNPATWLIRLEAGGR